MPQPYAIKPRAGAKRPRWTGMYYRDGRALSAGTYDTKDEALAAAHAAQSKVRAGTWTDPTGGKITFRAYAESWAEVQEWAPTTREGNLSRLNRWVLPEFGDVTLKNLTYERLVDGFSRIARAESTRTGERLAPKTVNECKVLVTQVLDEAVRAGRLALHPARSVKRAAVVRDDLDALTPEQIGSLLAAVPPEEAPLVELALETGARWGELSGLQVKHLQGARLRIAQTVATITKEKAAKHLDEMPAKQRAAQPWPGSQFILQAYAKSKRRRTIGLSPLAVALLATRIDALGLGPDDYFFLNTRGVPLDRGAWRSRVWRPAVEKAGLEDLPRVWFHDLRAAHASWLLAGSPGDPELGLDPVPGANPDDVMRRLGWTQYQTLQRYSRALPDADERLLAAFSAVRDRVAN